MTSHSESSLRERYGWLTRNGLLSQKYVQWCFELFLVCFLYFTEKHILLIYSVNHITLKCRGRPCVPFRHQKGKL